MKILGRMIEVMRQASTAACRVKTWRLTDDEAQMLSDETALFAGRPALDIYHAMKAGNVHCLGARIEVR